MSYMYISKYVIVTNTLNFDFPTKIIFRKLKIKASKCNERRMHNKW